jgi:hypothetical protein
MKLSLVEGDVCAVYGNSAQPGFATYRDSALSAAAVEEQFTSAL